MCVSAWGKECGGGDVWGLEGCTIPKTNEAEHNNVTLVINKQMSTHLNQFLTTGPFLKRFGVWTKFELQSFFR